MPPGLAIMRRCKSSDQHAHGCTWQEEGLKPGFPWPRESGGGLNPQQQKSMLLRSCVVPGLPSLS